MPAPASAAQTTRSAARQPLVQAGTTNAGRGHGLKLKQQPFTTDGQDDRDDNDGARDPVSTTQKFDAADDGGKDGRGQPIVQYQENQYRRRDESVGCKRHDCGDQKIDFDEQQETSDAQQTKTAGLVRRLSLKASVKN